MPIDYWLIFAYIMIFTSVIVCGIFPMILRLFNARRRFHQYDLERQAIEYSFPHAFLTSQSIYSDVQFDNHPDYSHEQIPYIDEDTSI
jgi:hypothetical protein